MTQKIHEEVSGFGEWYPFAFFMRDELGKMVGGCNGAVIFGVIYTDQLWVHQDFRKQGWGRKLMKKVHDYGRKKECAMATISTMNFQNARGFYESLGYVVHHELKGYINKSSCLFLSKIL